MKLNRIVLMLVFVCFIAIGCEQQKRPDLTGQWSGWGRVTLNGLTGSYSDSYGRFATKIELKWTGKNALKGTWSEGTYRFGWLMLTLSEDGNTLSGTWGADKKCEYRPGNPKTDTLTWTRLPE